MDAESTNAVVNVVTNVVYTVAKTVHATNFWDVHGGWFIFFMFLFPRLTMLFTSICFYPFAHPVLFWFGWVLSPRLVVAILATSVYWDTNPTLCVFAWIYAFVVGSGSNHMAQQQSQQRFSRHNR